MKIEKSELRYLGLSYLFILVLVLIINIQDLQNLFSSFNPIIQFLIFNIGLYVVFFFFLKGIALKESKKTYLKGALGSIFGFIALDIILPGYHLTKSGLIVGEIFGSGASDYFFGYIYQTYFNITGWMLVFMVYFVTFTILFLLAFLLVRNFVKRL